MSADTPPPDDIEAARRLAESSEYQGRYVDGHYQTWDSNAPDFLYEEPSVDLSYVIKPKKETEEEFNRRYANVPADERRTAYMPNPTSWNDPYFSHVIKSYVNWREREYQPLTFPHVDSRGNDDYLSLRSFARVMRLPSVGSRGWQTEDPRAEFYMPEETFRRYQTYINDVNVVRYNAMLFAKKPQEYQQQKLQEWKQERVQWYKQRELQRDQLERQLAEQEYQRAKAREREQELQRQRRAAERAKLPWYKKIFGGGDDYNQSANKPVHSLLCQNLLAIVILLAIIIIVVVVVAGIVCKPVHHKPHPRHYLNIF